MTSYEQSSEARPVFKVVSWNPELKTGVLTDDTRFEYHVSLSDLCVECEGQLEPGEVVSGNFMSRYPEHIIDVLVESDPRACHERPEYESSDPEPHPPSFPKELRYDYMSGYIR